VGGGGGGVGCGGGGGGRLGGGGGWGGRGGVVGGPKQKKKPKTIFSLVFPFPGCEVCADFSDVDCSPLGLLDLVVMKGLCVGPGTW